MKNHGYELEHDFGHGQKFLALTFAALNLLAFAWHAAPELLDPPWQAAAKRTSVFAHILTLTAYVVFPSWPVLLEALTNFAIPPELPKSVMAHGQNKIPYFWNCWSPTPGPTASSLPAPDQGGVERRVASRTVDDLTVLGDPDLHGRARVADGVVALDSDLDASLLVQDVLNPADAGG